MYKIPGKQIVLDTDTSLSSASDLFISSQLAVKTYVDNTVGLAVTRHTETITGDNSTTVFNIVHNFDSYDVFIQVYSNDTGRETINPVVSRLDLNTAQIIFAIAPLTTENFRVIVI